jgi:hypothetical protein
MIAFRLAAGVVALAAVVATTAPARGDLIGTPSDDRIRGHPRPNQIEGGAGDDRIWGSGGPDGLRGGSGDDLLRGQRGWDVIRPGHGADQAGGGRGNDRFFLRVDGDADDVSCGPGTDTAMYPGQRDASDTFIGCEKVWTDVTTPRCVTADEWDRVSAGMRKARVHRIFESGGSLIIQRKPDEFARLYLQCRPRGPYWECKAQVDFLVDDHGIPRVTSGVLESMCGTP